MQIKYSFNGKKIIKRPTHSKIARERRRLKKYKKKYDAGILNEYDIHNAYMSWRNATLKDCNKCHKSIKNMDSRYKELFPENESFNRETREALIQDAFRKEKEKCLIAKSYYQTARK